MNRLSELTDTESPRIDVVRDGPIPDQAGCVIWWMSGAKRATANQAGNVAIELANSLRLPVVAVFCLVSGYPRATERAYAFLAEGLGELPDALARRGVGWILRTGEPDRIIPELAIERNAAAVVTDLDPLRTGHAWRESVAARLSVPMVVVDANTVIPAAHFPKEEWAPRTIRPKIHRLLEAELQPVPIPKAVVRSGIREDPNPVELLSGLSLDRSVSRSPRFVSGPSAAQRQLERFVDERLHDYATGRNRSDTDGSSELSPYLHFGQISPTEVALAVSTSGAPQESVDSFINEVVVQRELCINFTLRNPDYDRYEGLPDWGRKTLARHADDRREHLYSRSALDAGETIDPLWNAAQWQMVGEGYMPNRLRMYWAKQLLLWTASPQEAFALACEMNDRYFVDGRDANGYAGVAWALGGRHDRPFPPERAVFGLVRPMSARGMKKHFDVDAYIAQVKHRFR